VVSCASLKCELAEQEISAESTIMLNGRIQQRILKEDTVRLQLSSVELSKGDKKLRLPEAILHFPKKGAEYLIFIMAVNCKSSGN